MADFLETLPFSEMARAHRKPCTAPKYAPTNKPEFHVNGKPFKTLATRELEDGWAILEIERVHQVGFFERVMARGYQSEQVAEQVALTAMGFGEVEEE